MKVKVFAICLILILALAVCAVAQGQGGPRGQGGRGRGVGLLNDLNLSDQQKQQIQTILQKYRADAAAVMQSSATQDEKKTKIDALKTKATADIKAVLTAEQWEKATAAGLIDKLLALPRRGPGGPPPGGPPPPAGVTPPPPGGTPPPGGNPGARHAGFGLPRILAQLNLTDAQKADTDKILKASEDAAAAVRNDSSLTPEAKRAKMQEIRKDTIAKIKAVLTPEQAAKFDELLKQMPGRPGGGNPPPGTPPPGNPPATNS